MSTLLFSEIRPNVKQLQGKPSDLSNAQQSCVPATALGVWLFVTRFRTESIDFEWSEDKLFFLCSEDSKNRFLVLQRQKILIVNLQGQTVLIFIRLGTENIDF